MAAILNFDSNFHQSLSLLSAATLLFENYKIDHHWSFTLLDIMMPFSVKKYYKKLLPTSVLEVTTG